MSSNIFVDAFEELYVNCGPEKAERQLSKLLSDSDLPPSIFGDEDPVREALDLVIETRETEISVARGRLQWRMQRLSLPYKPILELLAPMITAWSCSSHRNYLSLIIRDDVSPLWIRHLEDSPVFRALDARYPKSARKHSLYHEVPLSLIIMDALLLLTPHEYALRKGTITYLEMKEVLLDTAQEVMIELDPQYQPEYVDGWDYVHITEVI